MSTVQNSGVTTLLAGSQAAGTTRPGADAPQDRFLKLLVTQMRNQDPLNPLDNAQVTSQLAQISTVSGIDKLNATLQAMAANFAGNQSLQAAGMIDRSVLAPGAVLPLADPGAGAVAAAELPQAVDRLTVIIKDGAGAVVRRLELGPQPQGVLTFQWDGTTDSGAAAAVGHYSFSLSAQQGGRDVAATALAFGRVNSVFPGSGGALLDVSGLGIVGLSEIRQIL